MSITLLNSLGSGLRHYTRALEHVLVQSGTDVHVETVLEPSATGAHAFRWVLGYLGKVRHAPESEVLVVTWPVIGYWDFVAFRMARRRTVALIVHDPQPLVRAVGYGRAARALASRLGNDSVVVVHSDLAMSVAERQTRVPIERLPHPMLPPASSARRTPSRPPVIRVVGRYKPDRDLVALHKISALSQGSWSLEIVGRGWPEVYGWTRDDRFVSEEEFDTVLATSDVVLIPYTRFFQSGVAVRALEQSTPVVGPSSSSLAELLTPGSPWLVHDGDWLTPINAALGSDRRAVTAIATQEYDHVVGAWSEWSRRQGHGLTERDDDDPERYRAE